MQLSVVMRINQIEISKASYIAYCYVNYLEPNLIRPHCKKLDFVNIDVQIIETVCYPDYNWLFCREPIVIWCYQAF